MDPLIANLFIVVFTLVIFFIIGSYSFDPRATFGKYFLLNRNLGSKEYYRSFTASSTSLATVLIFFIQFGNINGIYILFAPLTYFAGSLIYATLLNRMAEDKFSDTGTTLADYMNKKYNSNIVAWTVRIITILGLICILLIELYVGISILKIYTISLEPIGLTLIVFLVAVYTGLGGFLGVLRTDKFQLWLMTIATIFLIIWLASLGFGSNFSKVLIPYHPTSESGLILPLSLLLNIVAVNAFLITTHLRTWQMTAASKSIKDAKKGIIFGGAFSALLWTGFTFIGILFSIHIIEGDVSLFSLLNFLSTSDSKFVSLFLFPLLFCGSISALVSTADSALLPVLYEIIYPLEKLKNSSLEDNKSIDDRRINFRLYIVIIIILVFVLLGYHLVINLLNYDFNSLLFTLFSLLIIVGPTIIIGTLWPSFAKSKVGSIGAVLSMFGGIVIALGISYTGVIRSDLTVVQYGGPISVAWAISILLVFGLIFKLSRSHNS